MASSAGKREESKSGRPLALIPVAMGVLFWCLLVPRAATPEEVPLPQPDMRALRKTEAADSDRVERVKKIPLRPEVLEVGSRFRTFNELQHSAEAEPALFEAKRALVSSITVLDAAEASGELLSLRAVQVEGFLKEVERFESTGEESPELIALAGPFVSRMKEAGWAENNQIALSKDALRAAYKSIWNEAMGVGPKNDFALSIDEQRALYAFFLSHPHVAAHLREEGRNTPETKAQCEQRQARDARLREEWRLDKVQRFGDIDRSYPTDYAAGILLFKLGRYARSAEAFRKWNAAHPGGDYARRSENYLRAAIAADQAG